MKTLIKQLIPLKVNNYLRDFYNYLIRANYNYHPYVQITKYRNGLEIGGPSNIFKYLLPVYRDCRSMSFVNYSNETVWEGKLNQKTIFFKNKSGKQYISEATDLSQFNDNAFEFIVSSNCLEHVANPLKALEEWKRVGSGNIILILPRKEFNFDYKRPVTKFEHILKDYEDDVDEHDLTHLEEILELDDLSLDKPAGTFEQFKNRCLHHHVFDSKLVEKISSYMGLKIVTQNSIHGNWVFLLSI